MDVQMTNGNPNREQYGRLRSLRHLRYISDENLCEVIDEGMRSGMSTDTIDSIWADVINGFSA
jgi:hypothetical protein